MSFVVNVCAWVVCVMLHILCLCHARGIMFTTRPYAHSSENEWTDDFDADCTTGSLGDLQTLICVFVARPRRCLTLSNPVPWQNWMAAYLGYTLRMKTLFHGWPIIVNDTHTRRRRSAMPNIWLPSQPNLVLIVPIHGGMARLSWLEWLECESTIKAVTFAYMWRCFHATAELLVYMSPSLMSPVLFTRAHL